MKGYLFRRGAVYYLRRNVAGRRVTESLGVTSRPAAEAERRRRLAADRATIAAAGRININDAWRLFLHSPRRRHCADSTLAGYAQQWARFAGTLPDNCDLVAVTLAQASAYLSDLRDAVGPSTYNKHVALLRYVWRVLALERGISLPDVWAGVQALPVALRRHEAFSTDQIRRLIAAAQPGSELRDMIIVAAHTGLRRVDVVLLDRSDVHLDAGMIQLVPEKTKRTSAQATPGISPSVRAVLTPRLSQSAAARIFPESAAVYEASRQTFGARFQRFMQATLKLGGTSELYGFHSFRHWFSTTLTEAGVQDRIIDTMMGHRRSAVANRYAHISAAALRGAVAELPGLP